MRDTIPNGCVNRLIDQQRVWQDDAAIHWEVADDGPGFDTKSTAGAGHGFVNMRDRMGAFAGTVDIISKRGSGTTIRGYVPLT